MGFSKKSQVDSWFDSEGKKWVIAGISLRTSLKPVSTKASGKQSVGAVDTDTEEDCTTPTAKEARIPERLPCPRAPRKRRPPTCHYNGVREFFTPPDLDTVFKSYVEKAN